MLQRVTFGFAGEKQLSRAFEVLADDARDLTDPLRETHEHLRQVIGEQFQTEGRHGGSRWQDLSPAYARAKEDLYGGRPILVATGDMRAAWLARQPLELTARRLVMGPKAGSPEEAKSLGHQTGARRLPQRKIVNLTTADKRQIDRIFVEYFSARARRMLGTR